MPLPTVTIFRVIFYLGLMTLSTNAQGVTTTAISTVDPSTTRTSASPTLASTTSLESPVPTTAPDLGDCISNCTVSSADENSATAQVCFEYPDITTAVRCVCNTPILRTALDNCVQATCPDQLESLFDACDSSQFKDPSDVVPSLGAPTTGSAPPSISQVPNPAPPVVVGGDSDGSSMGFGSADTGEMGVDSGAPSRQSYARRCGPSGIALATVLQLLWMC